MRILGLGNKGVGRALPACRNTAGNRHRDLGATTFAGDRQSLLSNRAFRCIATAAIGLLTILAARGQGPVTVRIEGDGYLRFLHEGRAVFTKSAVLSVSNGELKDQKGTSFLPPIRLSSLDVSIDESGWVTIRSSKVARLILAKLPTEPQAFGDYLISRERPELGYANSNGFGKIVVGRALPVDLPRDLGPTGSKSAADLRQGVVIAVPEKATVSGTRFSLGDVAQISGSDAERVKAIDLGSSPVHGIPLTYPRERILARIALLGIDRKNVELSMGNSVEVRRESQVVTPEQLLGKARDAVETKTGLKGELSSNDRLSEIFVPLGSLELGVESVNIGNGFATVTIGIRVDGKRFVGRTVRLGGAVLESVVQAGGNVTVRFVSSGLTVELSGRARTGGAIGQTIEVAITAQGAGQTMHTATVIAPGLVEVKI